MHLVHRWAIDEAWPDERLRDAGLRDRMEIRRHRTCGCGKGQCEVMDPGDPRDPIWDWGWTDDAEILDRLR